MQMEAEDGTVILKKIGTTLTLDDAHLMSKLLDTLAPFSQLVLDFTTVRECDDAAFLRLATAIQHLAGVAVVLRGLTRHEARLLKYIGLHATEICAQA